MFSKTNLYIAICCIFTDPELDGSQRIAVLQQKLSDLRKTYNAVKVELATIERRRKKLRRREREGENLIIFFHTFPSSNINNST